LSSAFSQTDTLVFVIMLLVPSFMKAPPPEDTMRGLSPLSPWIMHASSARNAA
jgi:hypothetical protein